jgi:hypothetical protein
MSEWVIVAIAAILALISRLESISIKFKSSPVLDKPSESKQLKK